jgi:hypothetical protein
MSCTRKFHWEATNLREHNMPARIARATAKSGRSIATLQCRLGIAAIVLAPAIMLFSHCAVADEGCDLRAGIHRLRSQFRKRHPLRVLRRQRSCISKRLDASRSAAIRRKVLNKEFDRFSIDLAGSSMSDGHCRFGISLVTQPASSCPATWLNCFWPFWPVW